MVLLMVRTAVRGLEVAREYTAIRKDCGLCSLDHTSSILSPVCFLSAFFPPADFSVLRNVFPEHDLGI